MIKCHQQGKVIEVNGEVGANPFHRYPGKEGEIVGVVSIVGDDCGKAEEGKTDCRAADEVD